MLRAADPTYGVDSNWRNLVTMRFQISSTMSRRAVALLALIPIFVATLVAPAAAATSQATTSPTAGMSLVFNQGFSGTQLNSSVWSTCYEGYNPAVGCTNYGTGEIEWYLPSQDQVSGGVLHEVASETPTTGTNEAGATETYPYKSGIVTTFGSFNFTYGYVSVVAELPGGTGTWPTIWLLPENGTWPPEVDIMENYGSTNQIQCTVHWGAANTQAYADVTSSTNLTTSYNTYGLLWTPTSLTWYLNGKAVFSYSGVGVPNTPMYLLANLAIDGAAAATSSFNIQSVQVYQTPSAPSKGGGGGGGRGRR
jgi:beta-glucanase (GH16 family)